MEMQGVEKIIISLEAKIRGEAFPLLDKYAKLVE
jgi:hypothetical protein